MEELTSEAAIEISALLRNRFGRGVGVAVRDISAAYPVLLEEEPYVARAVVSRRQEFSTGRWCARIALEAVGCRHVPIPVGPLREPQWPQGFVGSITHSAGLAAAIAAPDTLCQGIGVDLCALTAATILSVASQFVSDDAEVDMARAAACLNVDPHVLLFSAKESVIKVISANMGRFVDFTEIKISLEQDRFTASLAGFRSEVHGWWQSTDELLLTGASLIR